MKKNKGREKETGFQEPPDPDADNMNPPSRLTNKNKKSPLETALDAVEEMGEKKLH